MTAWKEVSDWLDFIENRIFFILREFYSQQSGLRSYTLAFKNRRFMCSLVLHLGATVKTAFKYLMKKIPQTNEAT